MYARFRLVVAVAGLNASYVSVCVQVDQPIVCYSVKFAKFGCGPEGAEFAVQSSPNC